MNWSPHLWYLIPLLLINLVVLAAFWWDTDPLESKPPTQQELVLMESDKQLILRLTAHHYPAYGTHVWHVPNTVENLSNSLCLDCLTLVREAPCKCKHSPETCRYQIPGIVWSLQSLDESFGISSVRAACAKPYWVGLYAPLSEPVRLRIIKHLDPELYKDIMRIKRLASLT